MLCRWCNGSREECGCGYGYCAHCRDGRQTSPPFGDGSKTPLSDKRVSELATQITNERAFGTYAMISIISQSAASIDLPDDEVNIYLAYWDDFYRDANLGEFIRQVSERAAFHKITLE